MLEFGLALCPDFKFDRLLREGGFQERKVILVQRTKIAFCLNLALGSGDRLEPLACLPLQFFEERSCCSHHALLPSNFAKSKLH